MEDNNKIIDALDFFLNVLNDFIGFSVLCVACVLILSYLRKVPPKFERKRMTISGIVLFIGAFISRFGPHLQGDKYPTVKDSISIIYLKLINNIGTENYKKAFISTYAKNFDTLVDQASKVLGLELINFLIGIICICAGAFILMQTFSARHITPMILVQAFGMLTKELVRGSFGEAIKNLIVFDKESKVTIDDILPGYNGFYYGCFMIIIIILYIYITKYKFKTFWTKKVDVVKHIASLLGLILAYALFVFVYGCIYKIMEDETTVYLIFKLLINIILAGALLLIPWQTYRITRGKLQNEFFEVERKEKVEMIDYSQAQSKAIRKYIHDLPKHFRAIDAMAEKIGAGEISQYINDLSQSLIETKCEFSTGNEYLDDLLVTELKNAKMSNTNIAFTGAFPYEGIKRKDLTAVFVNLIENAIEACKSVPEKREIIIKSQVLENRVYVSISNPYNNEIKKSFGRFKTTKKDNGFHGYGLSNVKDTVEKKEYDGSFSIEHKDNIFTALVDMKYIR